MDEEPDYTRILDIIQNCEDSDKLIAFVQNAQKKNVTVVAQAARLQLKKLIPELKSGSFENQFWKIFSAYEDLLLENLKPTKILNISRNEARSLGEIEALTNWINEGYQSWALNTFVSNKQSKLTAENLSLNHPELFDDETLKKAKQRLENAKAL